MRKNLLAIAILTVFFTGSSCSPEEDRIDTAKDLVSIPKGESPCTLKENTIDLTDNGHALRTFTKVSRRPGSFSGDTFKIEGVDLNHSMGDAIELTVHFNGIFKDNFLPPEGVYTTGTYVDGFPASNKSLYNIVYINYMTYTPEYFYYTAAPDQKVYVKWINGKMNIMACSIVMNGKRNGSIYPTPMLLSVTEN